MFGKKLSLCTRQQLAQQLPDIRKQSAGKHDMMASSTRNYDAVAHHEANKTIKLKIKRVKTSDPIVSDTCIPPQQLLEEDLFTTKIKMNAKRQLHIFVENSKDN
ncbi:hypothetical protein LOAG_02091 [Loa loa]|uniref:Uncharacterized protein n=1 Tax=Loa loa TaxID=7209 RepID=A0A1S0U9G0_LOALO|nr:hypothetical protein LOAG_02091 [Loa loa]EFO26399.1 hypothetical protein LOAG_02091 [Loa loa]